MSKCLADRKLDLRATKFLAYFEECYRAVHSLPVELDTVTPATPVVIKTTTKQLAAEISVYINSNLNQMEEALFTFRRKDLQSNLGHKGGLHGKKRQELAKCTALLLNLTLSGHSKLNIHAFQLLFRSYSERAEIRRMVMETHLLFDLHSIDLYTKLKGVSREIKKGLGSNLASNSVRQNRVYGLIQKIIQEEDGSEIKHSQTLFGHFDFHSEILSILRIRVLDMGEHLKILFEICYDFLILFCKENRHNQQLLWTHKELLMKHSFLQKYSQHTPNTIANITQS